MSYAVARMQKMKSGNLGGAYRHNERIFENHSNKDIDPEKTHLNYELTDRDRSIPYDRQIKQYINDNKISKRALRKDAVLCNEWIITSDKAFFENMSPDQIKNFFETAKNFFAERYGNSNIAYAMVHLDESTPHMHLGLVPMQNGKLSSKSLFGSRDQLKEIQEAFPRYLNEHGYNLQRGESDSKKKKLKTEKFKEKQRLLDDTDKKIVDKT
ncbi:MAG: MobV family relaxase, partial [Streptococcus sp.]|nr:MobV family relaxase [Streptococcus sp.]